MNAPSWFWLLAGIVLILVLLALVGVNVHLG